MNTLFIPPSVNWFESSAAVCAPDNTIVYASRNDVVVIEPRPADEPAAVKILPRRHGDRVICVGVNLPWIPPRRLFLSCADDKIVRLWNLDDEKFDEHHSGHTTRSDRLVGAAFAGNDRIVSVSEEGYIIIWRYAGKELKGLNNIFGGKVKITCVSSCPHATWLMAFGAKQGIIYIADLRGTGKIKYRLNNYENKSVVSLSWCPAPFNVFPEKKTNLNQNSKNSKTNKGANSNEVEEYQDENAEVVSSCDINVTSNDHQDTIPSDSVVEDKSTLEMTRDDKVLAEDHGVADDCHKNIEIEFLVDAESNKDKLDVCDVLDENLQTPLITEAKDTLKNQDSQTNVLFSCDDQNCVNPQTKSVDIIEVAQEIAICKDELKEDETLNSVCSDVKLQKISTNSANVDLSLVTWPENATLTEEDDGDLVTDDGELVKEYLLASAMQGGRSIIIWRAGTDGHKQIELYFPNKHRNSRNKWEDATWISLCWLKPKTLLSSSLQNELIEWNLTSFASKNSSHKWRLIHGDHSGFIFSIVAPPRRFDGIDVEDWRDKTFESVWTFGKDRVILNTSLSSDREVLALYPTSSGGVTNIQSSPLAPNRFAIVSGDGFCRLWDICRPHLQYISMPYILDKSKVACLAWHPSNDGMFAFGTNEGKVSIMDTNSGKKPLYLVHYFRNSIHMMQWGPLNGNDKNLGLYVLSGGEIAVYDIYKGLNEPTKITITTEGVHCFTWKSDYSMFAVGTKSGSLMLLSTELKCLRTIYLESKGIRFLTWHPETTADSDCSNWLALSATTLKVYNCTFNEHNEGEGEKNYYENIIANFNEHTGTILWLTWSPHQEGILASASDDGSVLVWNVKTKTLLHCCRRTNLETILCVAWSPMDPDFIITGSKDSTISIWKLSENLPKEKISKHSRKKYIFPSVPHNCQADNNLSEDENQKLDDGLSEKLTSVPELKRFGKNVMAGLAHVQNCTENGIKNCQKMFDFIVNKPPNDTEDETEHKINVTQIFGSKEDVNVLLDLEKNCKSKTKLPKANHHISLWQGSIGDSIRQAIADETLTQWHINIAPMISNSLWQEASVAYAKQLTKNLTSDPFLIASYYLTCHKVEPAIEILCSSFKFREALALAKIRLLDEDPLINSIIQRWAHYAVSTGQIEVAAQCCMALNQLDDAAKLLFKHCNSSSLKLAAELAKECENKDLLNAILYKLSTLETTSQSDVEAMLDPELNLAGANGSNCDTNIDTMAITSQGDEGAFIKPLLSRVGLELKLAGVDTEPENGRNVEINVTGDDVHLNSGTMDTTSKGDEGAFIKPLLSRVDLELKLAGLNTEPQNGKNVEINVTCDDVHFNSDVKPDTNCDSA